MFKISTKRKKINAQWGYKLKEICSKMLQNPLKNSTQYSSVLFYMYNNLRIADNFWLFIILYFNTGKRVH